MGIVGVETPVIDDAQEKAQAKKFIKEKDLTFPMLRNGARMGPEDAALKNRVNVEFGLPTSMILDGKGQVLFMHHRFAPGDEKKMEEEILCLLAEETGGQ